MLFIFAAMVVLRPAGFVPENKGRLIWNEAAILGCLWGTWGRKLF